MAPKRNRKPLNTTLAPRLRAFLDAFVEMNDRQSVAAVVEEALRDFFKARGIDVDASPEEILKRIIAEKQAEPRIDKRKTKTPGK
jgi:hypothetical protein